MQDDKILLRAINAEPHDDLPRLAYADWLEENGDAARGEFIRVQCRLAQMSALDPERPLLELREAELCDKPHEYERGFPCVHIGAERAELLAMHTTPLGRLAIDLAGSGSSTPQVAQNLQQVLGLGGSGRAEFWRSPHLAAVPGLVLHNLVEESLARFPARSPHMANLVSLEITRAKHPLTGPTNSCIDELAQSQHFGRLQRLSLSGPLLSNEGLVALGKATLPSLERLFLYQCQIDTGMRALCRAFAGLKDLTLSSYTITPTAIEAVACAGSMSKLESFDCDKHQGLISVAGRDLCPHHPNEYERAFLAILNSQTLPNLRCLRFPGHLSDDGFRRMCLSEGLGRLQSLALHCEIDDARCTMLAASRHTRNLVRLTLDTDEEWSPDAVVELGHSPNLGALRSLRLHYVTPEALAALVGTPLMSRLTHLGLLPIVGREGITPLAQSPFAENLQRFDFLDSIRSNDDIALLASCDRLPGLRGIWRGDKQVAWLRNGPQRRMS